MNPVVYDTSYVKVLINEFSPGLQLPYDMFVRLNSCH